MYMFFTERHSERWGPDKKQAPRTNRSGLFSARAREKKKGKKEKGRTGYTADIGAGSHPEQMPAATSFTVATVQRHYSSHCRMVLRMLHFI